MPGIGKITASKILNCFVSEEPIVDEKVKMKRA
jgi:5'-3' exonuclease